MPCIVTGEVIQDVATLLDDPGQTSIDADYVLPFMNLRYKDIVRNMAMLGLQYTEEQAIFTVPAGTQTLSSFMLPGGPLESLMQPIPGDALDWKLPGQDDTNYDSADRVAELDDQPQGTQGLLQFSWQGGTIYVTPSSVDTVARVRFNSLSTSFVDPADGMVRGIEDIVAFYTAEIIFAIRGNPTMQANCKAWGEDAIDSFLAMSVMNTQGDFKRVPAVHPRRFVARALPNVNDPR